MDCELWDLPFKIPWSLWRNSSHCKLDLKPYCCSIFLILNPIDWDFLDIPNIRFDFSSSPFVCPDMRTRNKGPSNWGDWADAWEEGFAFEVLGEEARSIGEKPRRLKNQYQKVKYNINFYKNARILKAWCLLVPIDSNIEFRFLPTVVWDLQIFGNGGKIQICKTFTRTIHLNFGSTNKPSTLAILKWPNVDLWIPYFSPTPSASALP